MTLQHRKTPLGDLKTNDTDSIAKNRAFGGLKIINARKRGIAVMGQDTTLHALPILKTKLST